MRTALAILVGSCVLAASPAFGDRSEDLAQGIAAYERGDFRGAVSALAAIAKALPTAAHRAEAWFYLGLSQSALKELEGARQSFAAALLEDPLVTEQRRNVPPEAVAEIEAIRKMIVGELRVTAGAPGSRVLVDGEERGRAPLTLSLPVGRHRVRVLSADSTRASETVERVVSAVAPVVFEAKLVPRMGRLRVRVDPSGAQILHARGRLVSSAAGATLTLPAGRHLLTFRAPGYTDASRIVFVEGEKTVDLDVRLSVLRKPWYRRRRAWGWVSLGLSAAVAGTGLYIGSGVGSSEEDIRARQRQGTLDYDTYQALASAARSDARLANILYGVAGAAAITGIVLFAIGESSGPRRAWQVAPSPGGASLALRF